MAPSTPRRRGARPRPHRAPHTRRAARHSRERGQELGWRAVAHAAVAGVATRGPRRPSCAAELNGDDSALDFCARRRAVANLPCPLLREPRRQRLRGDCQASRRACGPRQATGQRAAMPAGYACGAREPPRPRVRPAAARPFNRRSGVRSPCIVVSRGRSARITGREPGKMPFIFEEDAVVLTAGASHVRPRACMAPPRRCGHMSAARIFSQRATKCRRCDEVVCTSTYPAALLSVEELQQYCITTTSSQHGIIDQNRLLRRPPLTAAAAFSAHVGSVRACAKGLVVRARAITPRAPPPRAPACKPQRTRPPPPPRAPRPCGRFRTWRRRWGPCAARP